MYDKYALPMLTSQVFYEGDLRTRCVHLRSGNQIITDAPVDNKGRGEFFSPTDLAATSLASCMLTIMGIVAREHGFSIDGTRADVTKIMQAEPRRIAEIIINIYFPNFTYSEKQKMLLRKVIDTCPVALSLHPHVKQTVNLFFHS